MSLMGLDIGTTGTKVIIFNEEGKILASAYREYPLYHPEPGWSELDADEVWSNVVCAIREATSRTRDKVEALAISTQGEALTPVDRNGKALGACIVTFDNRSSENERKFLRRISRMDLFRITGHPPAQIYTLFKLLWWKEHHPKVFGRAWKFLLWEDYACYKLTGRPAIGAPNAARTNLYDVRKKKWSEKILGLSGIDENKLSEVHPAGTIAGEVTARASKETGLPAGAKVVAGAHDQPAGALGAGVIKAGVGMDATGTVECVCLASPRLIINKTMLDNNLCCYPHASAGLFVTLAFNFTGGALLKWYRDNFCEAEIQEAHRKGKDVYDIIFSEVADEPTNILTLAHFAPTGTPYFDPDPTGAIVGLSNATDKSVFIKGLLEGICYEIKMNLHLIRKAGFRVNELRAIGGGAKAPKWLQLKADMYKTKIVTLAVSEAASLGMAMLAGTAVGKYGSIEEAVKILVRSGKAYYPNRKRAAYYDEQFEKYRKLYPAFKKLKA